GHEFDRAITSDANLGVRIDVADAIPHRLRHAETALDGTRICAGFVAIGPSALLCADTALFTPGGMLVILIAQLERIDAQLLSQFVHRLFEREGTLGMAGGPHGRRRSGIGEDVVLFGVDVRAVIHVLRRAGCASTGANACGAVAYKLHR